MSTEAKRSGDRLTVPYGVEDWTQGGANAAPTVEIGRAQGAPLRLNTMPWQFPTPPDLLRLATTAERLDFLRVHLQSLCGLWDRLPRLFLERYFGAIDATIDANGPELVAALGASAGLFAPRDWSFSALCPLPRAHLPLDGSNAGARVRVDFAFWTGSGLIAVELSGTATMSRARRAAVDVLKDNRVEWIEIAGEALERRDMRALAPLLDRFWRGERLPSSPFRPATLHAIESDPIGRRR
jgi:hypothetical protein